MTVLHASTPRHPRLTPRTAQREQPADLRDRRPPANRLLQPGLGDLAGAEPARVVGRLVEYHSEPARAAMQKAIRRPHSPICVRRRGRSPANLCRDDLLCHPRRATGPPTRRIRAACRQSPMAAAERAQGCGVLALLGDRDLSPEDLAADLGRSVGRRVAPHDPPLSTGQAGQYSLESLLGNSTAHAEGAGPSRRRGGQRRECAHLRHAGNGPRARRAGDSLPCRGRCAAKTDPARLRTGHRRRACDGRSMPCIRRATIRGNVTRCCWKTSIAWPLPIKHNCWARFATPRFERDYRHV